MPKLLEIACFNLESVIRAQSAGADRIELCEDYKVGGITPDQNLISEARKLASIPIHVIIRPRGGNFVYNEMEILLMKKSILFCKENKIDGVVFGILNPEAEIDKKICEELVALARPMKVTFHRAFDDVNDPKAEIKKLIELGFDRLLSSGGELNASTGAYKLQELQAEFGNKIKIMPGGGIRRSNLRDVINISGCSEYHTAALTHGQEVLDEKEVKAIKHILSSC
jgi:copper homeostasis protein